MAADRTAPKAEKKGSAAERLRAEVANGDRIGLLEGREVLVKPVRKWTASARDAFLRTGNYEVWAMTSLKGDGYAVWQEIDPDGEQVDAFIDSLRDATGEDLGESEAS